MHLWWDSPLWIRTKDNLSRWKLPGEAYGSFVQDVVQLHAIAGAVIFQPPALPLRLVYPPPPAGSLFILRSLFPCTSLKRSFVGVFIAANPRVLSLSLPPLPSRFIFFSRRCRIHPVFLSNLYVPSSPLVLGLEIFRRRVSVDQKVESLSRYPFNGITRLQRGKLFTTSSNAADEI